MSDECLICKTIGEDGAWMTECIRCKNWIHNDCIGLSVEDADEIEFLLCDQCGQDPVDDNQQPGTSTQSESDNSNEQEYDVSEILDHAKVYWKGKIERFFRIKWAVWDDDQDTDDEPNYELTWEEEDNLLGCVGTLKNYIHEHKLEPTKLVERTGGAASTTKFNKRNWVTTEQVLKMIHKNRNMKTYKSDVEIGEWSGYGTKKKINILLHNGHFFVFLYLPKQKTCAIADHNNTYYENKTVRDQILSLINPNMALKVSPVVLFANSKADYCGPAAVMIALHFSGFVKNKKVGTTIYLHGSKLFKAIYQEFCKFKSQALSSWNIGADGATCPQCKKTFSLQCTKTMRDHLAECVKVENE